MGPSPAPISVANGETLEDAWYGNIQYLLNISAVGALTCLLIFVFVKLRSDHRRVPAPTAISSKLLAVWNATSREISHHCGADASQFLLIEGGTSAILLLIASLAAIVMLPVNIYAVDAPTSDEFSKTTINHIAKGSPLLWVHFIFVVVVVCLVHCGINDIERRLRITRFRYGNGNPSEPRANSTAIFTIMVHGVPKTLGFDKTPLVEYFQHKYPDKIYRVVAPMDLCSLDDLATELVKVRENITKLVEKIESKGLVGEIEDNEDRGEDVGFCGNFQYILTVVKDLWYRAIRELGFSDEERLRSCKS